MVGLGLVHMLPLAVTDTGTLARVQKTLDVWAHRGFMDEALLALAGQRLADIAKGLGARQGGGKRAADAGGGEAGERSSSKRQVRGKGSKTLRMKQGCSWLAV